MKNVLDFYFKRFNKSRAAHRFCFDDVIIKQLLNLIHSWQDECSSFPVRYDVEHHLHTLHDIYDLSYLKQRTGKQEQRVRSNNELFGYVAAAAATIPAFIIGDPISDRLAVRIL